MSRIKRKLREWKDASRTIVARDSPAKYESLENQNTFRLLKLPSVIGEFSQLHHFPLDDCPEYTALSYTWESPLFTDESIAAYNNVQGSAFVRVGKLIKMISISKSLDEALSTIIGLRFCGVLKIPEYIWADGLCINQQDTAERETQVPLMGEIYSNCALALVWLGRDKTDLDGFLHIHNLLEPIIRQIESPDSDMARKFSSAWTLQDLESVLGGGIDLRAWAAYVGFYEKRRWFSRTWVAQEVALPSQTIILCGHEVFPWERIQEVKDFLRGSLAADLQAFRSVHHARPAGYEVATMSRLRNLMEVIRRSMASPTFGELYPILHDRTGATTSMQLKYAILHECLTSVRSLESKWGHDKVYGVIGIFSKICDQDIDDLVRPNYALTEQEVFIQVTWLLLRELPNLCVLSSVEDASARRLPGLPSWVPDWTSAITNNSLVSMLGPSANASMVPDGYQGYRKQANSLLTLNGGFFDTIADVAESPQSSDILDPDERRKVPVHLLGSVFELCMNGPVANSHGQSTWEMLWRTMIANRTSSLVNLPVAGDYFSYYITQGFATYKASFGADELYTRSLRRLQRFQSLNDIDSPSEFIIDFFAAMHEDDVHVAEAEPVEKGHLAFAMLSGAVTVRRRFFRTREGHLGVGPLSMRKDDEIWLMDGAHYPFLLRPTAEENIFVFVGDLYLHGHMNGEMLQDGLQDRFRHVILK
ncbi:MAG: hypothetical protein Q9170_001981 [Blastenia crenularia]